MSGAVEIRGTAQIDDFDFYKVEFWLGDRASEIHVIGETKDTPVQNGVLVLWNTGNLSGPATLRLSVVKNDGNYVSCDVPVVIGQG